MNIASCCCCCCFWCKDNFLCFVILYLLSIVLLMLLLVLSFFRCWLHSCLLYFVDCDELLLLYANLLVFFLCVFHFLINDFFFFFCLFYMKYWLKYAAPITPNAVKHNKIMIFFCNLSNSCWFRYNKCVYLDHNRLKNTMKVEKWKYI